MRINLDKRAAARQIAAKQKGRDMKYLIPLLLLLGACGEHKTWQEACFERVTPKRQVFWGPRSAPVYDPVLTTREYQGRNVVYCDG